MARYLQMFIGIFYAMASLSLLSCIYNFFDLQKPIPEGQPYLWLVFLVLPPIILSVLDKLRIIFFPKEHENTFKDQLLKPGTMLAEVVAWAIPNMLGGMLWCLGILAAYLFFWWLTGTTILTEAAESLGLIVQKVK